jgi:hypothetical protein
MLAYQHRTTDVCLLRWNISVVVCFQLGNNYTNFHRTLLVDFSPKSAKLGKDLIDSNDIFSDKRKGEY